MAQKTKFLFRGVLIAGVLLVAAATLWQATQPKTHWWYPFIPSLWSDHYTTGPFAMTSNTREDNPVWPELSQFNTAQARMSYAMSLGRPVQDIAWLLPEAEWPDKPALSFFKLQPNQNESAISQRIIATGLDYDRVSPNNLLAADPQLKTLRVGHAQYQVLLISGLASSSPELLGKILAIADAGIPVLWLGPLPQRATGWAKHRERDNAVETLNRQIEQRITRLHSPEELVTAFANAGLDPVIKAADSASSPVRITRRRVAGGDLLLLFNESERHLHQTYQLATPYRIAEMLNPENGQIQPLCDRKGEEGCQRISLSLPARRTRLLYLGQHSELADNRAWNSAHWQAPPRSMHPYIRWWWPGDAVKTEEIRRELRSLAQAGFGGVEIQTLTIGFSYTELYRNEPEIYRVGQASFFEHVRTAFEEAQSLGLAVDLTLGSGWSSGGPFIDEHPEQQLLESHTDIVGPTLFSQALPAPQEPGYVTATNWVIDNTIGPFDDDARLEAVVAARLDNSTEPPTLTEFVELTGRVQDGHLEWQVPAGHFRLFALYQNATAHNTVASAYPGALEQSPVLDHLHRGGIEEYIRDLGEPWLQALSPYRPAAFFVDSFELIGELPWSSGFRQAFQQMHGYDVTPYLPLLFKHRGESKYVNVVMPPRPRYAASGEMVERLREDYELTRQHLFQEQFIRPLKDWTTRNNIDLRLQAHGGYGHYLDSYQLADIPESEALFAGGSFDFLKLASSAGHIAGRRVISSESFITMSLDFNRLDLDDYYFLAGNAFAAGINRTVCHGYAYHYPLPP